MVTLNALRTEQRAEVLRVAKRHGVRSLRVFGSVARGEAKERSDLDLLVEWGPGRSLLDHVGLVQDLEDLLGGEGSRWHRKIPPLVRAPPNPPRDDPFVMPSRV